MAATGGSSAQPLDVRRQASLDRQAVNQPVTLLLQQPTVYAAAGYANLASTRPGPNWKDWGTLLNRKVVVRDSTLGPGSGRGLFAGPRDDGFDGFVRKEVITIYGGKLLTNHLKQVVSYRSLNVLEETRHAAQFSAHFCPRNLRHFLSLATLPG